MRNRSYNFSRYIFDTPCMYVYYNFYVEFFFCGHRKYLYAPFTRTNTRRVTFSYTFFSLRTLFLSLFIFLLLCVLFYSPPRINTRSHSGREIKKTFPQWMICIFPPLSRVRSRLNARRKRIWKRIFQDRSLLFLLYIICVFSLFDSRWFCFPYAFPVRDKRDWDILMKSHGRTIVTDSTYKIYINIIFK